MPPDDLLYRSAGRTLDSACSVQVKLVADQLEISAVLMPRLGSLLLALEPAPIIGMAEELEVEM